jgi:polyisoprenoid-binding protein YceI
MKYFTALLFSLTILCSGYAQLYKPTDDKQAVSFIIKNFGLAVTGSFSGLQGNIQFNPASLAVASFKVTVDAGTVNTGNSSRDGHLKKEEYFNTAVFQKISIVSSKITNGSAHGTYLFEGVVSIKGINKLISFPFTAISTTEGYQFAGSFKINRRDFKVGGNSMVLSDNLIVNLTISAKKS